MKSVLLAALALLFSAGCGVSGGAGGSKDAAVVHDTAQVGVAAVSEDASWPENLPTHLGAKDSNAVTDAIQVWRFGAKYIRDAARAAEASAEGSAADDEGIEDEAAGHHSS